MEIEHWQAVVDFEGFYEVSSLGRVKRIARGKGTSPGRVLKSPPDSCGYPRVRLSKDGVQTDINVHILVATAFLGSVPPDCEVNHRDLNRGNNRLSNLEYLTHSKNQQHAADFRRMAATASRG